MAENRGENRGFKFDRPRPDKDASEKKISEYRAEIDKLFEELNRIKAKKDEERKTPKDRPDDGQGGLRKDLSENRQKLRDNLAERNACRDIVRSIDAQKKDLKDRLYAQNGDTNQSQDRRDNRQQPRSVSEVDEMIKKLEFQLETGSGSLKREQKIMLDIKKLEQSKRFVRERDDIGTQIAELDANRKKEFEKVEKYQAAVDALRIKCDELAAELDAKKPKEEKKDPDPRGTQQRTQLTDQIGKYRDLITEQKKKFEKEMQDWKEYKDKEMERQKAQRVEQAKRAAEERAKRDEEYKKKNEERRIRDREEARVARLNPKEAEIHMCDNLVSHLQSLIAPQREKEARTVNFDASQHAPARMEALNRDSQDDWLFADRTKKKPQPKKVAPAAERPAPTEQQLKKNADKPLHLTMQRIQALDKVGITVPYSYADIPVTIEKLKEKKAHFETFKRTQEEVDAEIDREDKERLAKIATKAEKEKQEKQEKQETQAEEA